MSRLLSATILLIISLVVNCVPASAGSLDPLGRITAAAHKDGRRATPIASSYVPVILELEDDSELAEWLSEGVIVWGRRDNLVLACIPEDLFESVLNSNYVMRVNTARRLNATLDLARAATNVTALHQGSAEFAGLTGKGIVVGFSDTGFDPSHEAFAGRVARIAHFDDRAGLVSRACTESEIADWVTDNEDMNHATHVAGILAGNGNATYCGVATGSDIVAATSNLYDVGILACVEEVIGHARETGCPAVINMSLGSTVGPHDGTDAFCRYLDKCGEDAVIVLAAGNDGNTPMSLTHTFTSAQPEVGFLVAMRSSWDFFHLTGAYDFWSRDRRGFKVRFRVFDSSTKQYVWQGDWIEAGDDVVQFIPEEIEGLSDKFKGAIYLASEVNPQNGRFNTQIVMDVTALQTSHQGSWALHHLEIDVTGDEGVTADLFSEAGQCLISTYKMPAQTAGNPDFSISNLVCGQNTIAVGSVNTRHEVPYIDGHTETWSYIGDGFMSVTSSYGTLLDGRVMPHICAPGAAIISAASGPYLAAHPDQYERMSVQSPSGDYYMAMTGTSMASPHAAGIFALWLEADPTLTTAEIRDIAMETASPVDNGGGHEGAGCIDALEGLRLVMKRAGITSAETNPVVIRREGRRLVVEALADENPEVQVFDLTGRSISPDALPNTPVVVRVITPNGVVIRKV